ncbi:MAG: sigma-70 family RNA polymerase sigma factor [Chloroflexi bacterium]|nr:sigma-70 family RNA polymerase sigma factor [Chloroflexota bacterium]
MAEQDPDRHLVQAMARGDVRALEELYARHGARLLAYLVGLVDNRQLAEEVLQDVMLAAWRGAASFRGDSRVTTWLLAIARLQALGARRRRYPAVVPLDDRAAQDDSGLFARVDREAEARALRAALRQLPNDQRETLELIFYHELSGPEAAVLLGVPEGTIKSRLNRAKTSLRRLLRLKEADHEA